MTGLGDSGATGELCVDLAKPIVGKPAGRVCVTPFDEVRVEHRLLKVPLVVSIDRVAGVVTPDELAGLPTFERELTVVHLPRDAMTPPNVALVLRAPAHLGPFRYGAQQVIPLTRRDRKQGVEADVLALSVDDPALLVEVLRSKGVAAEGEVAELLAGALPLASPEVAARLHETRRRRTRSMARKQIGFGVLTAVAIAARISAESMPWETVARLVAAGLAAAVLVALSLAWRRPREGVRRLRRWAPALLLVPLGAGVVLAVLGSRGHLVGAGYVVAWATLVGVLAGPMIGFGLRGLGATRPVPQGPPSLLPQGRRWGLGALAAIAATSVLVTTAVMEESAAGLVRSVQARLVSAGDLPDGWEPCCGRDRIDRGDSLDHHICGSDASALPRHLAGVHRSFNKPVPGQPDYVDAHLDVAVLLAPTVADAEAELSAIDSAGYLECTSISVAQLTKYWQPRATGEPQVTPQGREHLGVAPDLVIDTFRVRVPVDDVFDVTWVHFVRMRVGRAIVRMPILAQAPEPLDRTELEAIIEAARRAVVAPGVP